MKNSRKKVYNQKGITLIALVITIIILLILAGVSIAMLTGESGILTQAQRAKEKTEQAAQNEAAILDEYNNTLNNLINGGTTDVSIPEGLKIGSEVKYNPSGTYTWQSKYCSSPENTSYEKTLNSRDGEPFNINTWKVFDINESTGEVTLVPEHSTYDGNDGADPNSGTVYLYGAQGYNNGVKLLNDACNELYGDSSKGISARSINMTDIESEGKMTKVALEQAHSYTNDAKWGEQVSSGYLSGDSYYPSIYAQEILNGVDGTQSPSGLKISEQTSLIEPGENNGAIPGNGLRPTQTYWFRNNSFMQGAFETASNGTSYYSLLMPDGPSTYYWVASRCVDANSSNCNFRVSFVYIGEMDGCNMIYSYGYSSGYYSGLFPMVSLSSELINVNDSGEFEVK